jgi:hypothetical protein
MVQIHSLIKQLHMNFWLFVRNAVADSVSGEYGWMHAQRSAERREWRGHWIR